jgi:ribosomal protein L32
MAIKFKCSCGKSLSVPDKMAGKTGKCPACGKDMNVPTHSQEDSVDLDALPSAGSPSFADDGMSSDPTIAPPPDEAATLLDNPDLEWAKAAAKSGIGRAAAADAGANTTKGMKPCPNCNEPIKLSARICKNCGTEFAGGRVVKKKGGFVKLLLGLVIFVLHTAIAGVAGYIVLTEDNDSVKPVRAWVDEVLAKRTTDAPDASSPTPAPSASGEEQPQTPGE